MIPSEGGREDTGGTNKEAFFFKKPGQSPAMSAWSSMNPYTVRTVPYKGLWDVWVYVRRSIYT